MPWLTSAPPGKQSKGSEFNCLLDASALPDRIRFMSRLRLVCLGAILTLVTVLVYLPSRHDAFVNYDDPVYVTDNPVVQHGLTWPGVKWAFTTTTSCNWHPITWLSLMLDRQLFGPNPEGYHLTGILFHSLNVALVFGLLWRLTGATWRSMWVAAFFAVHPLHVESVAWVAERKDVLSAFFGLLTLLAYAQYAKDSEVRCLRSKVYYGLALFFFALGLMSKAMLVTWPFVMLLLDYWPLERFTSGGLQTANRRGSHVSRHVLLVIEKIPFLVLAAAVSYVAFVAQKMGGAVVALNKLPFEARFENALVSYCSYLGKLVWPTNLAVFYPYPGHWPPAQVLLAGLLLIGVSALLLAKRRQYPFLMMGWLWFCGTLVPVIGLVQVGIQAMADRYTYIPSIGVFIMAIWGAYEFSRRRPRAMIAFSALGSVAIIACAGLAREQLRYWHNSETLFEHALAVTKNNYVAHSALGAALYDKNQTDAAIRQYEEAIQLNPGYFRAHFGLAVALDKKGRIDAAIRQYQETLQLHPDFTKAHNELGVVLFSKGQIDAAILQYREALRLNPDNAPAYYNLGIALAANSRFEDAVANYRQSLRINPNHADTFVHLGMALDQLGRPSEAVAQYRQALRLNPRLPIALNNLAWTLATSRDDRLRNGIEAVRLAERACALTHNEQPACLGTLAAAYAECGRFSEAVTIEEKAEQLAAGTGQQAMAAKYRQLLELYRAGKPYHEPSPSPSAQTSSSRSEQ